MISPHFLKRIRTTMVGSLALFMLSAPQTSALSQTATEDKQSIVARGEYLAQAGDCVACHTAPGGKLFAGDNPSVSGTNRK